MSKKRSNSNIRFIPVNELKNKSFIVKDYQRGYKWEEEHIEALLNDINNHDKGKYCLQPLIVSEGDLGIELIDGQQRVISIYLLLHYLSNKPIYTIDYQTRESTQVILRDGISELKASAHNKQSWGDFCADNQDYDNVDIFHLHEVMSFIASWFHDFAEEEIKSFENKVRHQLYVIWYDVNQTQSQNSAEDVFLNLNAGKIPLTSSELIKALFILSIQAQNSSETAELKAYELANDWDQIENQLSDDSFWYFISDKDFYNNLDTRIDLVIDLSNEISKADNKVSKTAYHVYEQKYLNNETLDWSAIKQVFNKLLEWYQDKYLYHYIGFLVNTQTMALSDILALSKGKNKNAFQNALVSAIKKELSRTKKIEGEQGNIYDLNTLSYKDHRKECMKLLLLLNVKSYLRNKSSNKFPFDLYKKESWSVEHINPQNPKDLKDLNEVVKWLENNKSYFESPEEKEVLEEINDLLKFFSQQEDMSIKLSKLRLDEQRRKQLDSLVERVAESLEIQLIPNLALLDRNTNSKLGNLVYTDKRKKLLDIYYDPQGSDEFIPISTKDVFSKSFSEKVGSTDENIFTRNDMRDYRAYIEKQLGDYLPHHG